MNSIQEGPTRKAVSQGLILTPGPLRSIQAKSTPECCGRPVVLPGSRRAVGPGLPDHTQPRVPDSRPSAGQAPSLRTESRRPQAPG